MSDVPGRQPRPEPEPGAPRRGPHVHIVPLRVLATVFASLVVLTVLTVAAVELDLGGANLWLAMGIATVKATIVALWFMHLRYDRLFHGVIFLSSLLFAFLFIGLTLMDTTHYRPEMRQGYAPEIEQPGR